MRRSSTVEIDGMLLLGYKTVGADPGFRKEVQISFVSAGRRIFLAAPDAQRVFARGQWLNLLDEGGIDQRRSMDPDKSEQT
jgi:hypothetical protein